MIDAIESFDLLRYVDNVPTQEFVDCLFPHMFLPLIIRPTRITAYSTTLIGLITVLTGTLWPTLWPTSGQIKKKTQSIAANLSTLGGEVCKIIHISVLTSVK